MPFQPPCSHQILNREDAVTARRTLLANASFTAASAVFIFIARDWLYPLFALESPALLAAIAGGLLLYAGSLAVAAKREPPDRRALMTAAVLDAGWVVGSAIVLLAAWTQLAPAGRVLLIAAALIVEVFATLQYRVARSIAAEVGR
jgi:hypothetical protein